MILKVLNKLQEDYGEDNDDFFFSYEAFIGPEEFDYAYEVFVFNIISIKRLQHDLPDTGIMLNKGWMITRYFDENDVANKINSIIRKCETANDEDTYSNIKAYLRLQD